MINKVFKGFEFKLLSRKVTLIHSSKDREDLEYFLKFTLLIAGLKLSNKLIRLSAEI